MSQRGGRKSRAKGARGERGLVHALQAGGIAAERIPLSGAMGGKFRGDVSIPCLRKDLTAEVKVRAAGFQQIYAWLQGADLLAIKADRCDYLICMPLDLFSRLVLVADSALPPQEACGGRDG
jgi:Holliday junction resolvase